MELEDIIKWVDRKNQDLRNAEFGQMCMEEQHDETIYERVRAYKPEYDKYSYAIIPHILQLSEDNKKALIKRLFRNSSTFLHGCEQARKSTDDNGWVFIMGNYIIDLDCDDEDLFMRPGVREIMILEYELLGFYSEIIQMCVECELNPTELRPIDVKKEVIEDIIRSMKPIPQQKRDSVAKWQGYIIGKHREAWINIITQELNMAKNKNGKLMATIILALGQTGSVLNFKKSVFYRALRVDFPLLNSDEAINKYLNGYSVDNIPQSEIDAIKTKVGCF